MATSRRSIKLTINKVDLAQLESIARSRTEPAGRSSDRGFYWLTGKTLRSMRWPRPWDCMLKLSNAALSADSDEVARVKRDEAARDSWMMSPAVTE